MEVELAVVMQNNDKGRRRPITPAQRLWPATPLGVHKARKSLGDTLTQWGKSELIDGAGVVLSELMTNAFRYGTPPGRSVGVSLTEVKAGVLIEVHDARSLAESGEFGVPATPDTLAEAGRGLTIVDTIAKGEWGVAERDGPGKVVWAIVLNLVAVMALIGR